RQRRVAQRAWLVSASPTPRRYPSRRRPPRPCAGSPRDGLPSRASFLSPCWETHTPPPPGVAGPPTSAIHPLPLQGISFLLDRYGCGETAGPLSHTARCFTIG